MSEREPELVELFREAGGGPIKVDGNMVHLSYPLEITWRLTLEILESRDDWPQGVRIASHGKLRINGQSNDKFYLWAETAPPLVDVEVVGKSPKRISISNIWSGPHGTTSFGMGNCGMLVEELRGGALLFRCNALRRPIDFADIVFRMCPDPTKS